jgi:hypothetical protein
LRRRLTFRCTRLRKRKPGVEFGVRYRGACEAGELCPLAAYLAVKPEDLHRAEFDFVVVDADGHVALFSTAGFGPVPESSLSLPDIAHLPDPEGALLQLLHIVGVGKPEGRGPGAAGDWLALGARGVFVFSWLPHQGPYERLVTPSRPVAFQELPQGVRTLVAATIAGSFSATRNLNPPSEWRLTSR